MTKPERLEQLEHPPIVEAVCGVAFKPVEQLDAVLLGAYWDRSRDRFPTHRIHAALGPDGLQLHEGVPPIRVWLCSANGTTIVQLQRDRFFLNWQAGDGTYPRFSPEGGVREQALAEYESFRHWVHSRLGVELAPEHVEVTKVDHFPWASRDDVATLLPILAPALGLAQTLEPNLLLKFEDGSTRLSIGSAKLLDESRVMRMETTATCAVGDPNELAPAIDRANQSVNDVFARLIPAAQRAIRFGRSE